MENYIKEIKFSIEKLAQELKAGLRNKDYIVYKEEKDNKFYSANFEQLKIELLKYNIEFGKVPNKRVFYYLKKL